MSTSTLTAREVAITLRVTTRTVYNWVKTGRLKAMQVGRRYTYRFDPVDIDMKSKGVSGN